VPGRCRDGPASSFCSCAWIVPATMPRTDERASHVGRSGFGDLKGAGSPLASVTLHHHYNTIDRVTKKYVFRAQACFCGASFYRDTTEHFVACKRRPDLHSRDFVPAG